MRTLLLSLIVLSACSGSGVDKPTVSSDKKLVDLTMAEETSLCDYTSDVEGGYGYSKMCGDGITLTVKERAACIANLEALGTTCTATVANAEACAEAVQADLCKLLSDPACAFALQCTPG